MSKLKKDYYKIEPDIKNLVSIMNILVFKTYASCQGHCWSVDKLKPYFAFTCEMDNANFYHSSLSFFCDKMYLFCLSLILNVACLYASTGSFEK